MPADSINTRKPSDRKQSETKQNRKSKIHDTKDTHIHSKSNMFDNTYDENTRGKKYHRKTRYQSSSSSSSSRSSSSSSSSSDSDYDRHHHRRRHRQKSHSPTSKLQTFSGDGKISWDTFITQFERVADRHDWGKKKRTDKLFSSLDGQALEYVCKLNLDSYKKIKKEMSRRFNTKENPISARRKLQYMKQHEDESLQQFAQRVHFITIDGYK
ncbi:protein FAM133-like [Saccostrea echinata]|uniref:protein FAM133-like n=1 Tax=Saccostrea echinata TaxID=191078 RepID=UPI002A80FBF7|nr:protein FAM133-like [Saccostrea echinata]